MFHGWENFFYLIGSAAGALIGIMFIVITLTAGHEPRRVSRGAPVYVTPIVFHFAVVLVVSATSEVPGLTLPAVAVLLGASAIAGLAYSTLKPFDFAEKDGKTRFPVGRTNAFMDSCRQRSTWLSWVQPAQSGWRIEERHLQSRA